MHMDTTGKSSETPSADHISEGFNKIVRRSRLVVGWERTWPRIVSTAMTGGLFVAASWAGCWQYLPPGGRAAGALLFAAALVASPFRFQTGSPVVSRKDAIRRLDEKTGDPKFPARMLDDSLLEGNSPEAEMVWNNHREALWQEWREKLTPGKPSPDMNRHDPLRLRYAVAATVLISALAAGDQWQERLKSAFDWSSAQETGQMQGQQSASQLQIRAWVSPPEKIGKAPRHLTGLAEEKSVMPVHKASVLTILVTGQEAKITVNGTVLDKPTKISSDSGEEEKAAYQYETSLTGERAVVIVEKGPTWTFEIESDNAPKIKMNDVTIGAPDNKSAVINYSVQDDYGVEGVEANISPVNPDPAAKPLPSGRKFSIPAR